MLGETWKAWEGVMGKGPKVRFGGSFRGGSLMSVGLGEWDVFVLFSAGVLGMAGPGEEI